MKRVGTIAYPNNTGISIQSTLFCQMMRPDRVLLVDLTEIHVAAGKVVKSYPSRFDGLNTRTCFGMPTSEDLEWLLTEIDVVYFIETPLNWGLVRMAKERNITSIIHANFEFLDLINNSNLPFPDDVWMPSTWHYQDMQDKAKEWGVVLRYVDVPVDRTVLPFRPHSKARKFLFSGGHRSFEDRNGFQLLVAALPSIQAQDIQIIIRSQYPLPEIEDPRVRVYTKEVRDYWDVYDDADVLIMPRRYGGLCLPLSEAMSKGIVPIMLDISPQTGRLPAEWLVPAHYQKTVTTRPTFDIYECTPEDLAAKIDYFASLSEFTFTSFSLKADLLMQDLDWKRQTAIYRALLDGEKPPPPEPPEDELYWA